jgi:Flp pilus assembly protein TadD
MMAMRRASGRAARFLASAALFGCVALTTAGCVTTGSSHDLTGSMAQNAEPRTEAEWRAESAAQGARYRANPNDPNVAVAYARALSALGERAQAVAVLEQASMRRPDDKAVLGAYGRALAAVGSYPQALEVLNRAHSPDQPDWHILSAQGAVLDQMGQHEDAQRYYSSALKIVPDEPSVLSNLGLSYALSRDLPKAEATLRRAVAQPGADPRVRQNLALVVGLQGRFAEAETIARADLPPDEAASNVAYLKQMMTDHNDWAKIASTADTPSTNKKTRRKRTALDRSNNVIN